MPRALQEGVERLRHGNAAGAVLHLERALLEDPQDPRVWSSLAAAYEQNGQAEQALPAWREAARLEPDSPAAHYSLGVALERAGDPAGAAEAFAVTLRLQPQHARARAALARTGSGVPAPPPAAPEPPPLTAAERGTAVAASLEQLDHWDLPAPDDEPLSPPLTPLPLVPSPSPPASSTPVEPRSPSPPSPPHPHTSTLPHSPIWRSPLALASAITAGLILLLVFLVVRAAIHRGPAGRYVERSLIGVQLTLDRDGRFAWVRKGLPWRQGRYTVQGRELRLTPDHAPGVAPSEGWTGSVEPDGSLQFGPETYVRYQE